MAKLRIEIFEWPKGNPETPIGYQYEVFLEDKFIASGTAGITQEDCYNAAIEAYYDYLDAGDGRVKWL